MRTETLTVCDGKISGGFCVKCGQPGQTMSNYCGRLVLPPSYRSVISVDQETIRILNEIQERVDKLKELHQ